MKFSKIQTYLKKGDFSEAFQLLEENFGDNFLSQEDAIKSRILQIEILNYQSNYKQSLDIAKIALQQSIEIKNKILIVDSILAKVKTLSLLGELTKAENLIQTCFDHISLKGKKTIEVKKRISAIYHLQGVINYKRGELKQAFLLYQKSLSFFEKIEDKIGIASVKIGIGDIYIYKGEVEQALNCYETSLGIYDELRWEIDVIVVLYKISKVYHVTGHLEDASIYYKVALTRTEKIENKLLSSNILLNLIILLVDGKSTDEATEFLNKFNSIQEENEFQIIKQRYKVAQGIVLKDSSRLLSRMKAQEIFKEIAEEEIIDHEVSILAMFNLLESLLYELSLSGNIDVLDEVKNLLMKLQKIAEKQNSYSLLAKTSLFESKLSLLEMNFDKATIEISKALTIAQSKGLTSLAILISIEQDNLLEQKKNWAEVILDEIPFSKRIEMARMENLFDFMVDYKYIKSSDIVHESPILLTIVSDDGISLFTHLFDETIKVDSFLVSGFLSAINAFGEEVFAASGSIETIKHQEYTILIRQREKFLFSYVYKGQSYHAIQKLEKFLNNICTNKDIRSNFEIYKTTHRSLDESTLELVESYLKSNFLESS